MTFDLLTKAEKIKECRLIKRERRAAECNHNYTPYGVQLGSFEEQYFIYVNDIGGKNHYISVILTNLY